MTGAMAEMTDSIKALAQGGGSSSASAQQKTRKAERAMADAAEFRRLVFSDGTVQCLSCGEIFVSKKAHCGHCRLTAAECIQARDAKKAKRSERNAFLATRQAGNGGSA